MLFLVFYKRKKSYDTMETGGGAAAVVVVGVAIALLVNINRSVQALKQKLDIRPKSSTNKSD
jgi:hypothetical protein